MFEAIACEGARPGRFRTRSGNGLNRSCEGTHNQESYPTGHSARRLEYQPESLELRKERSCHVRHYQRSIALDFILEIDVSAQVMAAALAVYVTDSDLAGNTAESYGFLVTAEGAGAATFNVGDAGAAFGLIDGGSRVMTVLDILHATNDQAVEGRLYDMDLMLQELADKVYTMINELGGIEG